MVGTALGAFAHPTNLSPATTPSRSHRVHRSTPPARLQDDRRLDLHNAIVAHRRDVAPARTLPDAIGHDLLAAPGGKDHIGRGFAHHVWQDDPVLRRLLKPQFW